MNYLFHLSGEAPELALAEVKALFETYNLKYKLLSKAGHLVLIESKADEKQIQTLSERSALIKSSGRLIATLKNLELKNFDKIDWSFVKIPFAVRVEDLIGLTQPGIEAKLAGPIWWFLEKKGKSPEVNLSNPATTVYFIVDRNKIYVQKLIWKAEKGRFLQREPAKKPAFHPTALKPKLARLLVNLSRVKEKELLLDPFCGMASVLIESALIGTKIAGVDIDEKMINASRTNLKFYKISKFDLIFGNAMNLEADIKKNSVDAIATDPPYGRSSRIGAENIQELYKGFLNSANAVLKKNRHLAMLYPHYAKIEKLVNRKKWKVAGKGEIYVHGGLTRKALVLRKS